ncbi:SBBP repeat-containing protein [Runella salmonicolor]|uniref:SBBP repeat-containing protein n=1 Tax=Runella salmonicolor TaxID=2950278 RepID=A0ABT1FTX5_9BACT|nr:SBBP repeat-containing protein [Runella salmonicolor]MCP1385132.1 SBBP repeat-containing protein [Runella salmonicolor]
MTKHLLSFVLVCALFTKSFAQNVTILPSGITPAPSGSYPRLNYDAILALPSPQTGDMAYDLTFLCLRVYNGSKWVCTYQSPNDSTPNSAAIATAGGTGGDVGRGIGVDASGNIYVTGYFQGTATFGTTSKTSAGSFDFFVAKYNSEGTFLWVQTAGGTGSDYANGIAVDAFGNVYVTGYFFGKASFGETSKTSAGDDDIFVAKYNSAGVLQWVQTAGGINSDYSRGIVLDASGNVYTTGSFEGTAAFGATSKTSAGGTDIFVAKYNSEGILLWVQTAGGTNNDYSRGIAIHTTGSIYITGYFAGTVTFGTTSKTSAGGFDIFVAKFDPVGLVWLWVQTAGGGPTSSDFAEDIAVDASGSAYITGNFQGTATFGATSKTSEGSYDIFVAKYSSLGTFQWVQTAGGTDEDDGQGIALDASGNVYVTGYFQQTATFGATSKTTAGSNDIFVAKYSSAGALRWIQTVGGIFPDNGDDITIDANENLHVTGSFSGTAAFGATSKTSVGQSDIFVARFQQ